MINFKLEDSQINNVPNQEIFKKNLWNALEKVIPNANHESNKKLEYIKAKYGFISYEDAQKELGSIDEQIRESVKNIIKGLSYTKNFPPDKCLFMKANREDGSFAFAVIAGDDVIKYRADFFTPAYFDGHGGNHDLNTTELLGNLYDSVTLPNYPVKNIENI